MIVYKYTAGTYIIEDFNQEVNDELFNNVVNNYLKARNELDTNAEVKRIMRKNGFLIVCGYASLSNINLVNVIKAFLEIHNFVVNYMEDTPSEIINILKNFLPVISKRKGDQCGGINPDTPSIDPGILALSNSLNLFPGIKTFSSCEGHIKQDSGTMYILFTAETMENLSDLAFVLWNGLEEVASIYPDLPMFKLTFDFGQWPSIKKAYFEMRLVYQEKYRVDVFESAEILARYIKTHSVG
jgi:hypothetical protein